MANRTLPAHSLAEAYLYFLVQPCHSCGKGPVRGGKNEIIGRESGESATIRVQASCGACGAETAEVFQITQGGFVTGEGESALVNAGPEPSRIIDVAQWLTLFRMILEAAERESDKVQARHLGIEAAQCLEEALRFYTDEESDLPPEEAFFGEASRSRFRAHPEQFSKKWLLEMRSRLPNDAAMRASLTRREKRLRRWWNRLRRR
jgi:hypothetical protein